jgi:7,8-dihydropterin-6-yl-methyl-4-(beta-D-ribofuranosyl)aminobenzene 5'-phosphate synthase
LGGKFIEYKDAVELYPGIWLTGFVPRVHNERNWSGNSRVETPEGVVEDNIPEDLSMVIDTDQGLVVISGCGHAGIINTIQHARKAVREAPSLAVIGGFHLFENDDASLDWTAGKLKEFGVKNLLGGHCTGIEAVYRLRQKAGLERKSCVVSSVGSSFSLDKGLDPLVLAK